jgi:hypothetical protein
VDSADTSRRHAALSILGALGGAAFLGACGPEDEAEAAGAGVPTEQAAAALVGTAAVRWFDTVAELVAQTGAFDRDIAFVLGYWAPGDGGEGLFYWEAAKPIPAPPLPDADGGTILGTSAAGRWKRMLPPNQRFRSVKWFGAKGDGVADDADAIQACWNSLGSFTFGAEVFLPAGSYRVTKTLKFRFGTTGPWTNFRLRGEDAGGTSFPATAIIWDGPSSNPSGWHTDEGVLPNMPEPGFSGSVMTQFSAYDTVVENLVLTVAPGKHCGALVNFGYDPGDAQQALNSMHFKHVSIAGGSPSNPGNGTADFGVVYDVWRNVADQNTEDCVFEDCSISGFLVANVWFRATTQPFGTVFERCKIFNTGMGPGGADEPYGIAFLHNTDSLSLTVKDCDIQRVACHHYLTKLPQSLLLMNNHAEVCKKILYGISSGGNDCNNITIVGGRYSQDHWALPSYGPSTTWPASDVTAIRMTGDMTINLIGCNFASGAFTEVGFQIETNSANINSFGCRYPNKQPFATIYRPYTLGFPRRVFSFGDVGSDNTNGATPLPHLRGVLNPNGTVTISDTSTSAHVAFTNPEANYDAYGNPLPELTYRVTLSVFGKSSSAVVSTPYVSNVAYNGFDINVVSPPGAGQSVTISYELWRV